MFNSITIEKEVSYMGRKDIYTIEQGDKSIPITHKVGGFMHKKEKAETKKLTHTDFRPIFDAFNELDFTKAWKESGDIVGYDGWTLKCTISNVSSETSVKLWCPAESPENPETTKLLQACEKVFSLFE
ncbi:MAG: hypothetical protein K6E97_07525 [Treponema sp.]|nr:hypothetical protein [Treponema sp.]